MKKKNVILLHADQQRADSLGCAGNPFVRTPHLDRLAAEGTLCTRHIASNPICMPSRASLLTGMYPPGHNVWCNGVALNREGYTQINHEHEGAVQDGGTTYMPQPATLADMFAGAGYDTASFGKLHLTPYLSPTSYGHQENQTLWQEGAFEGWHGPYYGFRQVDMTLSHGEGPARLGHYAEWLRREHPDVLAEMERSEPHRPVSGVRDLYVSSLPFELHHSAWLADRLCEYVTKERMQDRPFFAFVGFPDPHHPFTPCHDTIGLFEEAAVQELYDPEGTGVHGSPVLSVSQTTTENLSAEDIRRVVRHTYAMVYQIDLAVGRVLDMLDREGLADDTIVAFTSDHGDFLGDHGLLRKGFGASDSLVHVPFVLRAPGGGLPSRYEGPMSNCDVVPTLTELCGVQAPDSVQGVSLQARAAGTDSSPAFCFSSNGNRSSVNYTAYDSRYRFTWYPRSGYVELFDHREDPGESRNIARLTENATLVDEMRDLVCRRLAEYQNPILARVCAW